MMNTNNQSKADHPQTGQQIAFSSCDLNFDPMTLIYERDLGNLKTYIHIKNEVSRSRLSKLKP